MFGILKPSRHLLSQQERERFASTYCNLCGVLSSQYGFSSRLLVVHDIATLWWLLEPRSGPSSYPLPKINCLRGGARNLHVQPLHRLLAAASAYTVGVKVQDDISDDGRILAKLAGSYYSRIFADARSELVRVGFEVDQLDSILQQQKEVEASAEDDFQRASAPSADAYGLMAREIASRCESRYSLDEAHMMGSVLGRAVYLADAIQDYEQDQGKHYNPLCCAVHADKLPERLRHQVLHYIGEGLSAGRRFVRSTAVGSWHSLERSLFAAAGVNDQKTVTLYVQCCIPCGDGAMVLDDGDCEGCDSFCTCVCCLTCLGCSSGRLCTGCC